MKKLITLFLIFISLSVKSQELNYHSLDFRSQYFLDSIGILYLPLNVRCYCDIFKYDIPIEVKNEFIRTHKGLEYLPNELTETFTDPEFVEMYGGKSTTIGNLIEIPTQYNEVIGFSDFFVGDDKMIRIVETKTEVVDSNIVTYYFNTSVFILDKYIGWYGVKIERDSVPDGWNPFYLKYKS